MGISVRQFGDTDAKLYTLKNDRGMELTVCDYGAVLVSLLVPDRQGEKRDVVLGYATLEGYQHNDPGFGATVGRNANRIGNAQYIWKGITYQLDKNDGENNLHSGLHRYYERKWEVTFGGTNAEPAVTFSIVSPDGDQGFPGEAQVSVTYTLSAQNEVKLSYCGKADQDTVFNMTNHSYFNLNGHASGSAMEHLVWIDANAYTPTDAGSIPTGEIAAVDGTPMDFREMKPVGRDIDASFDQLRMAGGYDHNWIINHPESGLPFARVKSEESGIVMEILTDLPGVQFYTANYLNGEPGKDGVSYPKRAGLCFETQYFPDAPNKPNFPSSVKPAGEEYKTETVYRFLVEG